MRSPTKPRPGPGPGNAALAALLLASACGGATPGARSPGAAYDPEYPDMQAAAAAAPAAPVAAAAPAQPGAPPAPVGPVRERAAQLREAADLLDKAEAAHERDAKSFAEQLFSSAELIVGPEAVAELAPRFREGAPPRVTTPTKPVAPDAAPQPAVVGDSEKDRPPEPPKPRPRRSALEGMVKLDGNVVSGDFAVVTLEPLGKKRIAFPTARVIEQRNRQFAPRVLVVPTGSLVSFPNFDPTFHNVFSTSSTKPFDLGLYRSGETREILFDKEGTIRLACNLHANMSAFIVVSSAPHYRITDSSGKFSFKNLEPGKYMVHVYSERATQPLSQEIEIKAGRNSIDLGVKADAPTGPLPDKFGVARGGTKS